MSTPDLPLVYVKNLPYDVLAEQLYGVLGQGGHVVDVRLGNAKNTRGTCIAMYALVDAAKDAVPRLQGVNLGGRYLVAQMYAVDPDRWKAVELDEREARLNEQEAQRKEKQETVDRDGEAGGA